MLLEELEVKHILYCINCTTNQHTSNRELTAYFMLSCCVMEKTLTAQLKSSLGVITAKTMGKYYSCYIGFSHAVHKANGHLKKYDTNHQQLRLKVKKRPWKPSKSEQKLVLEGITTYIYVTV